MPWLSKIGVHHTPYYVSLLSPLAHTHTDTTTMAACCLQLRALKSFVWSVFVHCATSNTKTANQKQKQPCCLSLLSNCSKDFFSIASSQNVRNMFLSTDKEKKRNFPILRNVLLRMLALTEEKKKPPTNLNSKCPNWPYRILDNQSSFEMKSQTQDCSKKRKSKRELRRRPDNVSS